MSDGFLGRWARRKLEVKREEMALQAQKVPDVKALHSSKQEEGITPSEPHPGVSAVGSSNSPDAQQAVQAEVQSKVEELVLPTEADLSAVAQGGEIRSFMNPQVSGDLRNKAFKALFSQPQFNQMDFMDVYVDDYSISKPLTAAMIDMMALGKQLLSRPDLEPKQVLDAEIESLEGTTEATNHDTHEAPSLESTETELLGETDHGPEPSAIKPSSPPIEQSAVVKNDQG
jgi:hypothetical protein